jgi:hypothetical protein
MIFFFILLQSRLDKITVPTSLREASIFEMDVGRPFPYLIPALSGLAVRARHRDLDLRAARRREFGGVQPFALIITIRQARTYVR